MLTAVEQEENRQKVIDILNSLDVPDCNTEGLIKYLDKSGFFVAPASTQYHHSYEGGLCEHSLNVYNSLKNLSKTFNCNYGDKTLVIVGLFHDLAKAEYYELYSKNVKDSVTEKWKQVHAYRVKDGNDRGTYGTNAFNTYMLLSTYMPMTTEEIVALVNHNCGMDDGYSNKDLSTILHKCPLTVLVHCADMIDTYMGE